MPALQMPLSNIASGIAGIPEDFRKPCQFTRQREIVPPDRVGMRMHSSLHAAPPRRTNRTSRNTPCEPRPLRSQTIQMGRPHDWVSRTPHNASPMLIRLQNQDIGRPRSGARLGTLQARNASQGGPGDCVLQKLTSIHHFDVR